MAAAAAATKAEETTEDILIDESKCSGHESTEVCDCEESQRNSDDGVEHRQNSTPVRLRSDVTVTYAPQEKYTYMYRQEGETSKERQR